jgi:hypothetical protein
MSTFFYNALGKFIFWRHSFVHSFEIKETETAHGLGRRRAKGNDALSNSSMDALLRRLLFVVVVVVIIIVVIFVV